MGTEIYIPQATVEKLNGNQPKGTRHQALIDMSLPLLGNGLSPRAVFETLRGKFPTDVTDDEINSVISWAADKRPTPSGFGTFKPRFDFHSRATAPASSKPKDPIEQCRWWLSGSEMNAETLTGQSPTSVPEDPKEMAIVTMETLYVETDYVNVVCKFIANENKANPHGGGKTLSARDWKQFFQTKGVPQSEAGAWVRPNPCKEIGSGADGAYTDADIVAHRFLLVESDNLPLAMQLAFYSRVKLPIAAILMSGGKSAHAWIRMDSPDEEAYREQAKRILETLSPFGFDIANKNPSRLSRLPGAQRGIGSVNGGLQRLLWLNPGAIGVTSQAIIEFEESLTVPAIEAKPMRRMAVNASYRYDELFTNRGKLGVPTGLGNFDAETGGLKKGQVTVLAAESNKGKTTCALNIAYHAATKGYGVCFFTLEMDQEEVFDLIVSMHCRVDRNVFNTGFFNEGDTSKIIQENKTIGDLPIWIFDAATVTVSQIRNQLRQLSGRVKLVVVDYVQILTADDPREPREQQVAAFARGIRILAKEMKLPFLILSQLNDEGKIRESRVIFHEAHNVILLETIDDSKQQNSMTAKTVKGRGIPKNSYVMDYEPKFCRITPKAKIDRGDVPDYDREVR